LGCVFSEVGIPKYEKPSEGPRAVAVQFMRGERHAMRPRRIPSPARQKEPLGWIGSDPPRPGIVAFSAMFTMKEQKPMFR